MSEREKAGTRTEHLIATFQVAVPEAPDDGDASGDREPRLPLPTRPSAAAAAEVEQRQG